MSQSSDPACAVGPATSDPPPAREHRAVLAALLVLVVGALLGAALFFVEQRFTGDRPLLERTEDGWRVASRGTRPFTGMSLAGSRVAWQQGSLIRLLDLESGKLRVLGPGFENRATWEPAASERFVVWFEAESRLMTSGEVWMYDLSSGRRRRVGDTGEVASYPSASGARVVWLEGATDTSLTLQVLHLDTMVRTELPAPYGEPLLSGDRVALRIRAGRSGEAVQAIELVDGRTRVAVPPAPQGHSLGGVGISGTRVAWGWTDVTTAVTRVYARSLDDAQTTEVAAATGVTGPAIDGVLVVWAQAEKGGGARIMGRRLDGAPAFPIATSELTLRQIAVSAGTVAWLGTDARGRSVIETTRVAQ